jgi:ElaB/YqjD/DUF883 family membrane-anchored ribosome-binding protein
MTESAMTRETENTENLQGVVKQSQELLKDIAQQSAEKSTIVRQKVESNLRHAVDRLRAMEEATVDKTRLAARATNDYVHENPWRTAGIAIGIGFLLSLLMQRRNK